MMDISELAGELHDGKIILAGLGDAVAEAMGLEVEDDE